MKVGLAEYTVRDAMEEDPFGALKKIASAGYKYIEWANFNADRDPGTGLGISANDLNKALADLGMTLTGALLLPHDPQNDLDSFFCDFDNFKRIVEYYTQAHGGTLSVTVDFFPDMPGLLKRCDVYNKLGRICNEAGMRLMYHNHFQEFQRIGGRFILDHILENTDAKYLGIELDAYWLIRGMNDPAKTIRKYGKTGRVDSLHAKDFPLSMCNHLNIWNKVDQDKPIKNWAEFRAPIAPEHFIEVGEGIVKIQDVIDAGNELNIPYIFVEQDSTVRDQIESVGISIANMKKMRGLEWD